MRCGTLETGLVLYKIHWCLKGFRGDLEDLLEGYPSTASTAQADSDCYTPKKRALPKSMRHSQGDSFA
uniref:Uncharacterized protein n=1 Tax=Steinernema glaseri TaxID=37863 RepID=A0A1I7ZG99_9BILA